MTDPMLTHFARLEQIAQADDIFRLWSRSQEEYAAAFAAFADGQPDEVQNLLWGYAEAGRLKYQRMVNLACMHMVFPEEKD